MQRLRPGLELVEEAEGTGEPLECGRAYRIRLRLWLRRGDPVRWTTPSGAYEGADLSEHGATLTAEVRFDRAVLMAGLYYGMLGMRVGGRRRLRVAPHLAYGQPGVPGVIPENALLIAEVAVLSEGPPA